MRDTQPIWDGKYIPSVRLRWQRWFIKISRRLRKPIPIDVNNLATQLHRLMIRLCCRNYYPTLVQHLFSIFTTSVMSHRGCSDIFTGIPAARISTDAASADRLDEWNQSAREYWSGFAADWHFEHKRSICCTFRSLFQNFSSASRFWLSIVSFPEPSSKRNRAVMRAYNLCEHRLLIHSQYQHQRVVT